ncbi:hypothetical protein ACOMHN_063143 [Nucella lapillus]
MSSKASWTDELGDDDNDNKRDETGIACFATEEMDNNVLSFTCRGENITAVPTHLPPNITQLRDLHMTHFN